MSELAVNFDFEQLEPPEPEPPAGIIAKARAEAEEIRAQAREEGLAVGHADGAAEVGVALQALQRAVADVHALTDELAAKLEHQAVQLALDLAGKIVAGALDARPELVVEVVQGALRRVNDYRQLTVLLNPADLELVRSSIGQLEAQAHGVQAYDLQSDQRVDAGGAIVRTVEGEIDASIATQLERAREVVASALEASVLDAGAPEG